MNSPDIIFFMVDQLAAKWLEAAQSGICPTPNIDRLQAQGTTFSNAVTSNPVCMATRSSMATGLNSRGHGVLENGYQLDPDLPTFMRILKNNGWRTAALGKVHFQPHFAGLHPDYKPYGFDVTHITEDSRGGEWLDWVRDQHPDHFESVLATIWPTKIPDYAAYGPQKENLRDRIERIRQDFQWSTQEHPRNTPGCYTLPFPEEVSQTNWITGHALDFINQASVDQPIYAHISYVQPHSPFCAPADYLQTVDADRIPAPIPAEWLDDPHGPYELKRREINIPEDWQYGRHLYFADLVHLDHQLGQVMTALEQRGRLDNTYLIFLSDHGELLYDHGFTSKEEKHYDGCIRVPLIIAGPRVQAGKICDEVVQLEDICPTVLDMAGLRLPPMPKTGPYLSTPAEAIPQMSGQSLLPLCRGETVSGWRTAAYSESYNRIDADHPGQWARTIRTQQWRYTHYPQGYGEQLFNLDNDPDEQHNLVADTAHQSIRQQLRDQLLDLIILQDYPKTRRNLFALGVH
ncbi:MAG: sulfatase-like hydrolase/transferase [Chloroflexota bacterium]